jgi:hypothetical protein
MTDLAKTLAALPEVERVSAWNDRHYINIAAARGSRANADLRTKMWVKGSVLTIETGKGYHSDAYIAAKAAIIAAVQAAGGTVREI